MNPNNDKLRVRHKPIDDVVLTFLSYNIQIKKDNRGYKFLPKAQKRNKRNGNLSSLQYPEQKSVLEVLFYKPKEVFGKVALEELLKVRS